MTVGQLVQSLIDTRRLGQIVALRLHVRLRDDRTEAASRLTSAIHFAATIAHAQPERIWIKPAGTRHFSAHIVGAAGKSLLVSLEWIQSDQAEAIDLVLVGQRGIAAWETGGNARCDEHDSAAEIVHGNAPESLLRAVHIALETALPVEVSSATTSALAKPQMNSPRRAQPVAPQRLVSLAPPLGVLLVTGAQSHQEMYARSFADDPRCRLIGLTDEPGLPPRRCELNAQLARELNIPLLADFDSAIRRDDVQIISICAAPERRARLIERCAAAGKQLYLDKPLAASVEEANAIVAAVERSGVQQQMFSLVHTNFAERVRRVVQSGELGELQAVHCDAFFAKGMPGTADLNVIRREVAQPTQFEAIEAKREAHNVGVYSLVMLRWLLQREVRHVYANTCNYFFSEHQRANMEDYAHLSLELEGGVIATVATGRTGWRSHAMGGLNRVVLVGSRKTVCVDWYKPRLEVWADEAPWQLPERHPEDPMGFWGSTTTAAGAKAKTGWVTPAEVTHDVRYFVDCLVAGRSSDVTAHDAAAVLEMLMAAYESAATGCVVALRQNP